MGMDFPEHLLRLGWVAMRIWNQANPSPLKPSRSPPLARLRVQLEDAYRQAEESVCASGRSSYIRNLFLISLPNQAVRREVLLVVSLVLYMDFANEGFHRGAGLVSRIASLSLCDKETDELAGMLLARKALGELLSAKGITIDESDSVTPSNQLRYFLSCANVVQESGLNHERLKRHLELEAEYKAKHPSQQSQKRPLRRLSSRWQTQKRFEWKPDDKQSWN